VLDARRAGLGETREQYQQALEDAVEARSGAQLKIEVIRKTVAATQTRQFLDMVTANAAKAARLPDYGITRGCRADIVVRDALSVHEALRMQPLRRHVIKDGREIVGTKITQEFAKVLRPGSKLTARVRAWSSRQEAGHSSSSLRWRRPIVRAVAV
jgi:hypothetical protein